MLRVFSVNVGLLTWLNYTVWIALFPLGFVCEGKTGACLKIY